MGKLRMKRKSIIVGSIFVLSLVLLMPSIPAIEQKTIEDTAYSDLPDLIVEDIFFYNRNGWANAYRLKIQISNIGDSYALGEFSIKVIFIRNIFGVIPFLPCRVNVHMRNLSYENYYGPLGPSESHEYYLPLDFDENDMLPGFYRIFVVINKEQMIQESNYLNNRRSELFFKTFGHWYP